MFFCMMTPEVFLGKGVLKIYSKITAEHPFQKVFSIELLCNFIEITLRHGCSPVNWLHIFRTPYYRNISGGLPLEIYCKGYKKYDYYFMYQKLISSEAAIENYSIYTNKLFYTCGQNQSKI